MLQQHKSIPCPACNGRGGFIGRECGLCEGSGRQYLSAKMHRVIGPLAILCYAIALLVIGYAAVIYFPIIVEYLTEKLP